MSKTKKLDFVAGNQLSLLFTGEEYFPALIHAIDNAEEEVTLETYIFSNDLTANAIKDALCNAAKRGVHVRVVIDWIGGGASHVKILKNEMTQAGVKCHIFNPWFRRGLARTHRKLALIDENIAFVGGINIINDLVSDNGSGIQLAYPRWDFAVQITGALVPRIQKEMEAQWKKLGHLELMARLHLVLNLRLPKLTPPPQEEHTGLATFIVRDNIRNRNKIRRAYLLALGKAQHKVILANPYFAPGRNIRNALISAANRGVDVTLILGVGAFKLQDAVAQSFYPKLLACGVKIIEYRKTELHAKVAVIDDEWATVGSSNIDGLSLFLNHEANIVIKDVHFAQNLARYLEQGIADGDKVHQDAYQQKSWQKRVWYRFAYLAYRGLMRIATLGQYR
jgi:cardiolipin synthase